MSKLMNAPAAYVDEALEGLCSAFPGYRRTGRNQRVVARTSGATRGQVGVVSGGGFGHLPLFAGYVGDGILNSCAVGDVFAGPPRAVCADAIRAADGGSGVLCVLGNYGGDRMSFAGACDDLEAESVATRTVIVADDIASAHEEQREKRRGVAGMVFAFKAAGASAARGDALDAVTTVAERAARNTRSIGIGLSPCTIPGASSPGFAIEAGHVAIGMGIHGEPGLEEVPLPAADVLTDQLIARLLAHLPESNGGRAAMLVNSLGATPLEELLIIYRRASTALERAGLQLVSRQVGYYATSMEMAGCSISLLFTDPELEALLAAPTACPFWQEYRC